MTFGPVKFSSHLNWSPVRRTLQRSSASTRWRSSLWRPRWIACLRRKSSCSSRSRTSQSPASSRSSAESGSKNWSNQFRLISFLSRRLRIWLTFFLTSQLRILLLSASSLSSSQIRSFIFNFYSGIKMASGSIPKPRLKRTLGTL